MDRQEAITIITRLKNMTWLYRSVEKEQTIEALDMAIDTLKANQPHGEWVDEDGNKVGTGLGLYITKATIDKYEGEIRIITNNISGFGLNVRLNII